VRTFRTDSSARLRRAWGASRAGPRAPLATLAARTPPVRPPGTTKGGPKPRRNRPHLTAGYRDVVDSHPAELLHRLTVRHRTDRRASGRLHPASRAPAASLRDGLRPPLTRASDSLLCSAIGSAPPSVHHLWEPSWEPARAPTAGRAGTRRDTPPAHTARQACSGAVWEQRVAGSNPVTPTISPSARTSLSAGGRSRQS